MSKPSNRNENSHTVQDHQYGYDPDHVHEDGEERDHDHDHDFSDSPEGQHGLWMQDNVILNSVGIDIGSSGTQVVFSRIHMRRIAEDLSSRYVIVSRDSLYHSPITLTPYLNETQMDARALGQIVTAAYEGAGLHPDAIDTGAVILTGEALRRENGQAIADVLAEQGGEFVCATAGHHMEAMLAVYGSGTAKRSYEQKTRLLNIDIGGGTTKLGLVEHGELLGTAAIHLGGRLIVVDDEGKIIRLDPAGRHHAQAAGFNWEIGSQTTRAQLRAVADWMAAALMRTLNERFTQTDLHELFLTDPIEHIGNLDGVIFSGGVGEYVYERETRDFHDLGKLFGEAVRSRLQGGELPWPLLPAVECIRATVLGASEYSIQLSGNTTFISAPGVLLPRKNLQVVPLDLALRLSIDPLEVCTALRQSFARYDLMEGSQDVALALRWNGAPSYERLSALADGLLRALSNTLAAHKPIYVIADGDVAHSLGNILKEDARVQSEVLVIDGVTLWGFDYVDLGRIRMPSRTVPVTVKSLVFTEDPRFHGKSTTSTRDAHDDHPVHQHGHGHEHSHGHRHDHEHSPNHDHDSEHEHGHAHDHGMHTHDHPK